MKYYHNSFPFDHLSTADFADIDNLVLLVSVLFFELCPRCVSLLFHGLTVADTMAHLRNYLHNLSHYRIFPQNIHRLQVPQRA